MSFWDWAVAVYAQGDVAEACLELQDEHGQCVPLLLWAAWCEDRGVRIGPADAERACAVARPWAEEVVAPLRAARRRLKTPLSEGDDTARLDLREAVKTVELRAERALMTQLEALAVVGGEVTNPLLAVAQAWSPGLGSQALVRLSQALTKGQNLEYGGA